MEQQEYEFPLHERLVVALQFLPHPHPRGVKISVAQQHAADEEEARHMEEVDEMVEPLRTATVANHHQYDTDGFRHVQRQVALLFDVLCHIMFDVVYLCQLFARNAIGQLLHCIGDGYNIRETVKERIHLFLDIRSKLTLVEEIEDRNPSYSEEQLCRHQRC